MAGSDQIVQEVEQFYNRYIDGFNREDIDLFMQSFDLPFAVLSGDHGATIFADDVGKSPEISQAASGANRHQKKS